MKTKALVGGLTAAAALAFTMAACSVEAPVDATGKKGATDESKPAKGGGKRGSEAASSGQKSGDNASAAKESAAAQGAENEGVVCDPSLEGVGWCADDASILFCSAETWWLLDCRSIEPEAFCGYDLDLEIVDCFVLVDDEDEDECLDLDEACIDDVECCSGVCDDDGYCD